MDAAAASTDNPCFFQRHHPAMNSKFVTLAALLGAVFLSTCAGAADELAGVRAEAVKKFAGHEVVSVHSTPIKGIYEVVLAPMQILYTDARVDYVLTGSLIDMAKQTSITDQRMQQLTHVDFAKLPFERAIKTVRGNGARKFAVFSDPDCPYCKKLEHDTLSKLDNVTIYTFLFPLDQHADAQRKAGLIWCAPDRNKAWQDWMQNGALPGTPADCALPVQANLALGQKLGVRATPTLIFPQGELVPGVIGKDELEAKLKN